MVILAMALMTGTAFCGPCHQAIARSYQQTAHFLTSSSADSKTIRGSFLEGRNILHTSVPDVYFRMDQKGSSIFSDRLRSRPDSPRALRSGTGLGKARAKLSLLEGGSALPTARLLSGLDRGMDQQPRLSGWRSAFRSRHPPAVSGVSRDRGRKDRPVSGRDHLREMSRAG